MSSREFDSMLDDLVRQALYPFAEAEPPVRVWRRVLRAVRSMCAEFDGSTEPLLLAVLAGFSATFSRFSGFLSWVRGTNVNYVPLFSSRVNYVDQNGRSLPSPFWDITLTQMFDLRLAS